MNNPTFYDIANFMSERHQIYLKRKAGLPGPWTSDPILSNGRFCNIFRELDTVTIWIRKNIREPFADHRHLWFMLCIARYINWPPTLGVLIGTDAWPDHPGFAPDNLTSALEALAASRDKVYTGAYMIRAESNPRVEWYNWTKHRYIAEIVLGRLWSERDHWGQLLNGGALLTQEEVWNYFQSPYFIGWGPFMAYEVVTDLRHTRYLREAPDIYTWANAGPGAIRGLNRLYGRELKAHPKANGTCDEMRTLLFWLDNYQGFTENIPESPERAVFRETFAGHKFEMRDVEHTLCEFDKYQRVLRGEGKMRSGYHWTSAQPLSE